MSKQYLQKWQLTDDQRKGVELIEGGVVVTAGAGTGKTRVLTHRFAHLVLSGKAEIEEILAITFTEKAAAQMIDRVSGILREENRFDLVRKLPTAAISTIHAFCARTLREYALEAGVDPGFEMLDEFDKERLARLCLELALKDIQESGPTHYDVLARTLKTEGRFGADILTAILKIYDKIRSDRKSIAESFRTSDPTLLYRERSEAVFSALHDYRKLASTLKNTKTMEQNEIALENIESALSTPNFEEIPKICLETKIKSLGKIKEVANALKERLAALARAAAEVYAHDTRMLLHELVENFHQRFSSAKRERSLLDFSDLEQKTMDLLNKRPDIAESLMRRYRFVLVDEFQDVNPLQAQLIRTVSGHGNLFVVGDHKQSIYGFRHADVKVFQDFIQSAPRDRRVSLDRNFRTVRPVLDFVNGFFENLWAAEESDIPYEPLRTGAESQNISDEPPAVEFLVSFDDDNGREAEASTLAKRIRQMLDAPKGEAVKPGEIVVLFQSKKNAQLYMDAFLHLGIPYQEVKGQGFFQRAEIADLQNYLQILSDPYHEIALTAVLRSPFVQLDPSCLFLLSMAGKAMPGGLIAACRNADQNTEIDPSSKEKISGFLQTYDGLLLMSALLSPSALTAEIYNRTGYRDWALTQPDAARKIGNMESAGKMADTIATSMGGSPADIAAAFAEFRQGEYRSEDASTGPAKDAVTVMTIHAAKGLEAPVVILADCDRKPYVSQDPIVYHLEKGIGFKIYLPDFTDVKTESYAQVTDGLKEDAKAEARRLFYVASTRAEKRMIYSAGFNKNQYGNYIKYGWAKDLMDFLGLDVNEADTWPPTLQPENLPQVALVAGHTIPDPATTPEDNTPETLIDPMRHYDTLPATLPDPDGSHYLYTTSEVTTFASCARLYYLQYRLGLPTELLGEQPDTDKIDSAEDDSRSRLDAMGFGNAFHELMYHATPENLQDIQKTAAQIGRRFQVPADQYHFLGDRVISFYNNPETKAILKATKIHRELPLVWQQQNRMIRGQIDLIAEIESGLWLVDYKTNQLNGLKAEDILARYKMQLILYALGVKAHFGRLPQRACLYLTEADCFVDAPLTDSNFIWVERVLKELFDADMRCKYPPNEKRCPQCRHRHWCLMPDKS